MIKFKTGNVIVKIEWYGLDCVELMGAPLAQLPVNSVNPPLLPPPC